MELYRAVHPSFRTKISWVTQRSFVMSEKLD